jgi:hypothetical protein
MAGARSLASGAAALGLLAALPAAAAPPSDRIGVARSAELAADRELGAELGWGWGDLPRAPLRLKGAIGRVEPRLWMDSAGIGEGAAGMVAEAKVGLLQGEKGGLAAFGAVTVPWPGELFWAEAAILGTLRAKNGLSVRGDLGLRTTPGYGVTVPLAALLDVPLSRRWSLLVDAAAGTVAPRPAGLQAAVGATWRPTDLLTLDARAGWDVDAASPYAALGLSTGLGKVR